MPFVNMNDILKHEKFLKKQEQQKWSEHSIIYFY